MLSWFLANPGGYPPGKLLARVEHSIQSWILIRPVFSPSRITPESRADCRPVSRNVLIIGYLGSFSPLSGLGPPCYLEEVNDLPHPASK